MMNHETVTKQAKKIMDEFVEALEEVDVKVTFGFNRDKSMRTDYESRDKDGTEMMFENAPRVKDRLFLAERKRW